VTRHTMGQEVLVMSTRAWADLSQEDRAIFRAAARESTKYMREQWLNWEGRSEKEAAASGVTIIDNIDRRPFEDATRSLREELRADPKLRPLIERIEAAQ
jgi:TRAP-type C4-dicarboxylate transport system substrate-binding protein